MRKNDRIELLIEDLGADGSGIGKIDSMVFFVKDALVGDRVAAKVMKLKKTYGYAKLAEIIEPSPYRVAPRCPLHQKCGGCQLQALSYGKQLQYKQDKILNSLVRIGGFEAGKIPMEPMIGMEVPFFYRNKAQFPVGRGKDGKLAAGFYAARTHTIIPVEDCCLGVPQNKQAMQHILAWMEQHGVEPYDEKNGTGLIRHVLVRYGFCSHQVMVCLVINGTSLPAQEDLVSRLIQIEGMASISISANKRRNNVIMGDTFQVSWGASYIEDFIGDVKFCISPLSFYQVNPVQAEVLYHKVLEYAGLTGCETVWDLYCGIGTISLFLAKQAKRVYGIEVVPQAVEDAVRNAKINGIQNVEFFAGEAEDVLEQVYKDAGDRQYPQTVIVDPPRKGCGVKLLDAVLKVKPQRVVYVSCDPATLARDLKYLCAGGYEIVKVQGVDQFCQTVHVEVAALLVRKP